MDNSHDFNEPVAWIDARCLKDIRSFDATVYANGGFDYATPLYTHSAREWQSLTDEDIAEIRVNGAHWLQDWVARAIEARLKEKNT